MRDNTTGVWYWNPEAHAYTGYADLRPIPKGELVTFVAPYHIDYPAMTIFLRSAVGEQGWAKFVERFGIPPVILTMPSDIPNDQVDVWRRSAEKVAEGGSGAVPFGTGVNFCDGARGINPFKDFIHNQRELVVLMSTGGLLTSLTEAGSGTLAGGAHSDTWAEVRRMDSAKVGSVLNRTLADAILDRAFPGRPHLACFAFDTDPVKSPGEVFEDAGKAKTAGYLIDQADLEERTGYRLVKDETAAPQLPGMFGNRKLANKATVPAAPSPRGDDTDFPNPAGQVKAAGRRQQGQDAGNSSEDVLKAFARDTGPAADAIKALLQNPSKEAAKALLGKLDSLLPEDPEMAAVIAEAMAAEFKVESGDETKESSEEEIINSECHITDHLCRIHDATKIEMLSKKTPDEAQRDCRIALEKMLKDHQPITDCIWRQSTGVIDIEWGDETGGICHIIKGGHGNNIMSLPEVLAKGAIYKDKQHGRIREDRFAVVRGQQLAILQKDNNGCYVLTGFHPNARSYISNLKKGNPPLEASR